MVNNKNLFTLIVDVHSYPTLVANSWPLRVNSDIQQYKLN